MNTVVKRWANFDKYIYLLFISTLPLFSIRGLTYGYSISVLILFIIFLRSMGTILVPNAAFKLNRLDILLGLYILISALSVTYSSNESYGQAIIKSCFYFLGYLALKRHMSRTGLGEIWEYTVKGAKAGIFIFLAIAFISIVSTGIYSSIFSDLSYWGITFRVFQAINTTFTVGGSGLESFTSAATMRNTIGEIFAIYVIIFLLSLSHKLKNVNIYLFLSFGLVVFSFSRRALLACILAYSVIGLVGNMSHTERRKQIVKLLTSLVFFLAFLYFAPEIENRFESLVMESRTTQMQYVINDLNSKTSLLGNGFGAKIPSSVPWKDDTYVHNFVLGSFYMTGVVGFFLAILIYLNFIKEFFMIWSSSKFAYRLFLLVPLIGVMVSSTVEGIFTPGIWWILALVGVFSNNRQAT